MSSTVKQTSVMVPRFYRPWPHQLEFWNAVDKGHPEYGKADYIFAWWARQTGKDVSCQQRLLYTGFKEPGQQHVYVGLDNIWVRDNIFKKYVDGRRFWDDYPEEIIEPKDTQREVYFHNNPLGVAPTRIAYKGLLNEKGVIGSSYRDWMISETSLYPDNAFQYVLPIWQMKKAQGIPFQVIFNGTPRGMSNIYFELFKQFTGKDDPEDFPGWHKTQYGTCFVSKVTIADVVVPDHETGLTRTLYTPEQIEALRSDMIRTYGNDNLFRQEYFCDFLAVNAGVVYQAWEILKKEGRFTKVNRDPNHSVYMTMDLGSKGKFTDATAVILWQHYQGITRILECYEFRGLALTEVLAQIAIKSTSFPYISYCSLPWDVKRGYTEEDALTQAQNRYPMIKFEALEMTRAVSQDIVNTQMLLPNLWVDNTPDNQISEDGFHSGGGWFAKCIENYQYKRIETLGDWGSPKHDWSSHMMDCLRYLAATIKRAEFANTDLSGKKKPKTSYGSIFDEPKPQYEKSPIYMSDAERREWHERQRRQQSSGLGDMDAARRKQPWVF